MARDDNPPPEPTQVADAAAIGLPAQPEQIGQGKTLVRTRPGYEFYGSTIDKSITSVGVLVTADEASKIKAEAEANGEIVYISNQEG